MMKRFMLCSAIGMVLSLQAPANAQETATGSDLTVSAVASVPNSPTETTPAPVVTPAPTANTVVAAVPPQEPMIPQPVTPIEREISEQLSFQGPTVNVNAMPSLFFTVWEHDLILDARRGLNTRMPGSDDGVMADSGPRDVSLAGIVYVNAGEWTIWLNGWRVSPTAIPDEVMDLKVHKNYIDLEWFDASTNQIFPIRLRPHQRFNLDTRMFLPG